MALETTPTNLSDYEVIITGDQKIPWYTYFRQAFSYHYLLRMITMRELKARYKNSVFGVLWSLLNPLFMMLVYTMLFTVLRPGNVIRTFYIFVLVGLVPWQFLSGTLQTGVVAITRDATLVKKVYFPRILLPMAALLSNFVNFLFAFAILLLFLFISGIGLTVHALWVPVILVIQIVFVLGLSLILSALNVFYRDVNMILSVALMAWFFLTPIFYPFEDLARQASMLGYSFDAVRVMRWINPMASIVDGYRTVLWGTVTSSGPVSMEPLNLLRTFITSLIIFAIGFVLFRRVEHMFGEKL
ncbi:MAG: ABC transporter permease [Anaerolineales bacterium]|nr:ABC transporter permease [Anaerolineales bacterium]